MQIISGLLLSVVIFLLLKSLDKITNGIWVTFVAITTILGCILLLCLLWGVGSNLAIPVRLVR